MSMCSSGRVRKKRGEGGRKKEKMTVADGMSFAVAFYGCAVVEREREARALGGKNDGCLFCFLSAQKSRPDASKSAYVTDGVRDGLRVCLGKHFTRWLQHPGAISRSLSYFL